MAIRPSISAACCAPSQAWSLTLSPAAAHGSPASHPSTATASSSRFSTSWKPHPRFPSHCSSASSNSIAWSGPSRKRWSWAAGRIVPVLAERTEKHLAQAADKRVERWRRLALEAAKQSRRSDLPEIADPSRLAGNSCHRRTTGDSRRSGRETAACAAPHPALRDGRGSAAVTHSGQGKSSAGREDHARHWTGRRMDCGRARPVQRAGWQSASLGPRILRVETAAIAALAVVNAASLSS